MILKKICVLFIFVLSLLAVKVRGECTLTKAVLEANEYSVFAVESNQQLHLLRNERVKVGDTLHIICNVAQRISSICRSGNVFDRPLNLRCTKDKKTKDTVQLINDNACSHQMYRVGYQIGNDFLEIYRSCYNVEHARAYYTIHDAYKYSTGIGKLRPEKAWTTDSIITALMAGTFESKSVKHQFNFLLGNNHMFLRLDNAIDRGHLTPSNDFLFENNMNATFKYINVIPQFKTINRAGNWFKIEEWVRLQLHPTLPSKIVTGAIDVLELPINIGFVSLYLANKSRNPIPKWIFKFIVTPVDNSPPKHTVFMTYNNINFVENRFLMDPNLCAVVRCPIALSATQSVGRTYCCDPVHFKTTHLSSVNI